MSSNWVNALDACAAAGIINYDAPAFLNGTSPRYIGHPQWEELPLKNDYLIPKGIKLKDVPQMDTYKKQEDKTLVKNPTWKKLLFGALTIGCLAGGALCFMRGKFKMPSLKFPKTKKPVLPNMGKVKTGITNSAKKIRNIIKAPFVWIINKAKHKP